VEEEGPQLDMELTDDQQVLMHIGTDMMDVDQSMAVKITGSEKTKIDLEILRASVHKREERDKDYADNAVILGEIVGIFDSKLTALHPTAQVALGSNIVKLEEWKSLMYTLTEDLTVMIGEEGGEMPMRFDSKHQRGDIIRDVDLQEANHRFYLQNEAVKALDPLTVETLNVEQRRAFDIIKSLVTAEQKGEPHSQILMLLHGEGGTRKSRVIQTIIELFK
jgi:hypothetical protein